jgi:HlyD family secretion protein
MGMDVKRDPAILRKKRIRQIGLLGVGVIIIVGISVAVMRLQPAAPSVPAGTVWVGAVQRGSFTREVHGAGTLVPVDLRWIPATTAGRVEEYLQPGEKLTPGKVVMRLSNPDLMDQLKSAELDWKSSQASLENLKATLKTTQINQEAAVSAAKSQYEIAKANYNANKALGDEGIVSQLTVQTQQATVDQSKTALDTAETNLQTTKDTIASQTAPAEALVNQKKSAYDQVHRQVEDLSVKSNLTGLLAAVPVDIGAQVSPGTNLVRVVDPTKLKANVRISETTMRDLTLNLPASIDTRNGIVKGHVIRIDPAAVGGTVGVDVALDEALPPGARQDMSVDGTVELEQLTNVLYVQHPAFGQENSTVTLFKLAPNEQDASRVTVKFGKASVNYIEVTSGLSAGDKVILSDMSAYDQFERIRGDAKFPITGTGGQ